VVKLRVLHVIGSFHQGGSEHQAVQLVRLLHREGSCHVFVAALDGAGILRTEIERLGFDEIPEFPLSSFYDRNALRQVQKCSKFIRDQNINVVQTHDFYTNVFGITAAALARVPARIAAKRETGMRSSVQRFVERRSYNLAHCIAVNSNAVRDQLIREGVPPRKIETIYNGLDWQRLSPSKTDRRSVLEAFGLKSDGTVQFVTILANLRSRVKNHEMFLRSAQIVKKKLPNVNFIVAGEGDLISEMRAMANELGLEKEAHFIGRCTEVAELLSISNVCVLSSLSEGFANSILEYMAAGKPVVATDVGGAREAVVEGVTGYLVPSNDHKMMADRLIDLLQNRSRAQEFGLSGRERIRERFSLENQLNQTLELYQRLSKGSGS
jgi:L-malate glycosyltransferase